MNIEHSVDVASSPALVEIAVSVRAAFLRDNKKITATGIVPPTKAFLKAADVAQTYFFHKEQFEPSELEILYEILREFGIIPSHIPPDFATHVLNCMEFFKRKQQHKLRPSHLQAIIFVRL